MERGSVEQRLAALVEILDVPPDQRDPAVWSAIQREATRVLAYRRRPRPPRESDEQRGLNSTYSAGLVRALGESRDPIVIPLLIEYSGASKYAIDGVARFGDLAVPAMLRTAKGNKNDLNQKGGVASALAALLRGPVSGAIAPLSDTSHREITAFAEELLAADAQRESDEIVNLASVALATGRPDLRVEVERLATDRAAWMRHGVVSSFSIELGQRVLQAQLKKTAAKP